MLITSPCGDEKGRPAWLGLTTGGAVWRRASHCFCSNTSLCDCIDNISHSHDHEKHTPSSHFIVFYRRGLSTRTQRWAATGQLRAPDSRAGRRAAQPLLVPNSTVTTGHDCKTQTLLAKSFEKPIHNTYLTGPHLSFSPRRSEQQRHNQTWREPRAPRHSTRSNDGNYQDIIVN